MSPSEDRMQVDFERSGGVTGVRLVKTVDTDALSVDDAATLRRLVEHAAFFRLPALIKAPTPSADHFQYHLTVRTPEKTHTVDINEGAVPPAVRPLIDWLTKSARQPPER